MKRLLAVMVVVLIPGTVVFSDESTTQYKLESHIYRLLHEPIEVDWEDGSSDGAIQRESNKISYRIGNTLLRINGDSFRWDGDTSPPKSDALLISSPNMLLLVDQKASIVINSGRTMEYLEKESGKGNNKPQIYRLKHITLPNELQIDARILPGAEDGHVQLHYTISVAMNLEREPIEGTSLDVGKPIITQIESTSDIESPVDLWFHTIVSLSETDYVLVLFKVEERKPI